MSRRNDARVPEGRLTGGLSRLYQYGMFGVMALLAVGLLYPLAGWEPGRTIMTVGVVALMALPIVSVFWVGGQALMEKDRHLILIVAGIVVLMVAARFLPLLFY